MGTKKRWYDSTEDLLKLFARIVFDPSFTPDNADALYLFSHNVFFEDPIIKAGADLWHSGKAPSIFLSGGGQHYNQGVLVYSGENAWREKLVNLGVPERVIISIPRPEVFYTHSEARHFVEFAKSQKWINVIIVAYATHILRAVLNTLTFIVVDQRLIYPTLRVYAQPSDALPWDEVVMATQWKDKQLSRIDAFIEDELKKIQLYWTWGDMPSCMQALQYFMRRDVTKE